MQMKQLMVSSEDSYSPNSQSPYSNTAVNDAKASLIISLLIKQSKMDQERVGTRVLIGKTGDNICLNNSLFAYLSRRGNNPGPLFPVTDPEGGHRGHVPPPIS